MTRLASLPDNGLITRLKNLVASLESIKVSQRQSGKGGLLGYLTQTANTWDKTETLTTGSFVEIEIVFTGNSAQEYSFVQPYIDIFFGGTANSNRPNPVTGVWTDGTNIATMSDYLKYDVSYSDSVYQYRWTVSFTYFGTITYYLKAYVVGSSPGTVVVTRTF